MSGQLILTQNTVISNTEYVEW